MTAQQTRQSNAERVRQIAELALSDAVEITCLINVMQKQNTGGINNRLNEAGAGQAAVVVRNALVARLVTLIARAYPEPKKGDMHLREAARILETDNLTRQIFAAGAGKERVASFDAHWTKCRGDHRLERIKHFRDKFTAHLGEPKNIEAATYTDLFAFGGETARAMELLAVAAGVAVNPIKRDPEIESSAEAFWTPWSGK